MKSNLAQSGLHLAVGCLVMALGTASVSIAQELNESPKSEFKIKTVVSSDEHDENSTKETIHVTQEDGVKTVKHTVVKGGKSRTNTYTGKKADEFLRDHEADHAEVKVGGYSFNFTHAGEGAEDIEVEIKELLESHGVSGDSSKVFMFKTISCDSMDVNVKKGHLFHGDTNPDELKDVNHMEGYQKIVLINADGKKEVKLIEGSPDEVSREELEELLESLDVDVEGLEDKSVKKLVIKRVIHVEDIPSKSRQDTPSKQVNVKEMEVYPNPSQGQVTLKYLATNNKPVVVTINDTNGKEIARQELNCSKGEQVVGSFDLSSQGKGIYFLRLTQKDRTTVKKLVID